MQRKYPAYGNQQAPFQSEAKRTNRRIQLACLIAWAACLIAFAVFLAEAGVVRGLAGLAYPAGMLRPTASPVPAVNSQTQVVLGRETVEIVSERTSGGAAPVFSTQTAEQPTVLIYHTHATEAYLATALAPYEASGRWRTEDPENNVIAVGKRLKQLLMEEYGVSVLHDTVNHEPPKLSTAYSRSLETMLAYKARYPSLTVFIDVHRDAYGAGTDAPKDYLSLDGRETARLMCVVGTGEGATGSGFAEMPDFASNLAFANCVTTSLRRVDESLARDVRIKTGRYNQHVSDRCLLIEVGHNANTLEQALNAVPYLAAAVSEALHALPEAEAAQTVSLWQPDIEQTPSG